ncbi:MAG: HalX domain-containing protein, partial [Halobacteria archaeon]|nr:HalX domain-containing protein [Halobacteria archaeon]
VTAVDPDFDIVDMPFDHYITKPVDRDELEADVEYILALSTVDNRLQEYRSLCWKRKMLEKESGKQEVEKNQEYKELND